MFPLRRKPHGVLDLEVQVVALGVGAHADALHLAGLGLLGGVLELLLLLIAELAVVHDAADRGTGLRRHLDQVEAPLIRFLFGLGEREDA